MIPVLAAVIRRGQNYLLCRRPLHKRHGGLWEFPGGKVNPGETREAAATRELAEELALQARGIEAPLFTIQDSGSTFLIEFVPVEVHGEPRLLEHASLEWLTMREAAQLDLAPSDRRFVEHALRTECGLAEYLAEWGEIWRLPDFHKSIELRFSTRLTRVTAKCRPKDGVIVLSTHLQHGPMENLIEALCHEAAHVAAYRLYGQTAKPHGEEWQTLLSAAGFPPRRVHSTAREAPPQRRPRRRYQHLCPVCQTVRYAGRPVREWRCAVCHDQGLPGEMVIERVE